MNLKGDETKNLDCIVTLQWSNFQRKVESYSITGFLCISHQHGSHQLLLRLQWLHVSRCEVVALRPPTTTARHGLVFPPRMQETYTPCTTEVVFMLVFRKGRYKDAVLPMQDVSAQIPVSEGNTVLNPWNDTVVVRMYSTGLLGREQVWIRCPPTDLQRMESVLPQTLGGS